MYRSMFFANRYGLMRGADLNASKAAPILRKMIPVKLAGCCPQKQGKQLKIPVGDSSVVKSHGLHLVRDRVGFHVGSASRRTC